MKSRATMQQRFVEFAQEMPERKQQTPEAVRTPSMIEETPEHP
jgi:hypothetical protein